MAVYSAYRQISEVADWQFYRRAYRIHFAAPYSTGTLTYDHCLTPEHEALTMDGWKTFDQLRVGEMILAYDHDKEICEWQPVEDIHTFDYDGQILEVERDGHTVFRCTPNHRIPVFERYGKRHQSNKKRFVKASELTPDMSTPLAAPIVREQDEMTDSRIASPIGWVVTDGSGGAHKNESQHVAIHQSHEVNPDKCAEIEELVGRTPSYRDHGMCTYSLKPEGKHVIQYILRKQGLVPTFARFAVQEAEAAFRAMLLAEASTHPNNGQKIFSQWGKNREVGKGTRYQCTVRKSKTIKLAKNSKWVPYKGLVWCPQVKSGAWMVRCNGYVMATGNSGGAHERLVTFSTALSSTVQGWVASGKLLIGSVLHEVAALKTSTTVTLAEALNPGQDVAAGTSFTLFRSSYDMPGDFRGAWMPIDEETRGLCYIQPHEWHSIERQDPSTTTPVYWTVLPSENSYGTWSLRVHGYPTALASLDFLYQGRGRPIRFTGYETNSRAGTVTISAGATTVTGTSTAFSSAMIGSVIRVSSDTSTHPTGLGDLNPWAEQKVITAVASTTSLTVDSAFSSAYTDTKYTISDPLDVDESLYDLLLATADMELARIRRHERLGECIGIWKQRRRLALENNNTLRESQQGTAPIYTPWSGGSRIDVGPGIDVTP